MASFAATNVIFFDTNDTYSATNYLTVGQRVYSLKSRQKVSVYVARLNNHKQMQKSKRVLDFVVLKLQIF